MGRKRRESAIIIDYNHKSLCMALNLIRAWGTYKGLWMHVFDHTHPPTQAYTITHMCECACVERERDGDGETERTQELRKNRFISDRESPTWAKAPVWDDRAFSNCLTSSELGSTLPRRRDLLLAGSEFGLWPAASLPLPPSFSDIQ